MRIYIHFAVAMVFSLGLLAVICTTNPARACDRANASYECKSVEPSESSCMQAIDIRSRIDDEQDLWYRSRQEPNVRVDDDLYQFGSPTLKAILYESNGNSWPPRALCTYSCELDAGSVVRNDNCHHTGG